MPITTLLSIFDRLKQTIWFGIVVILLTLSGSISAQSSTQEDNNMESIQIKITVGHTELTATLEDNPTTQALLKQMPITLPMLNIYDREMCFRYGENALPTSNLRNDGYDVGDIAYWPPGGSLVILYRQNGERFERQHLGKIDGSVKIFEDSGDTEVTFERINNN